MGTGVFRGAAHGLGPVRVGAGEDQALVAGGVDPAGVQVAGVRVGEIVAVALGPADDVVGVTGVRGQAGTRVRTVEGDGGRDAGVGVGRARPVGPRVPVVELPGDVGQDDEQVGRAVVADREGDPGAVAAVGGGQDGHVGAGAPVRRDRQPPGQPPVMAGDRPAGGQRRGLRDAGEPGTGHDPGGALAVVMADAVDVDAELLGRVDGDVEVDRPSGGHPAGGTEPLDPAVPLLRAHGRSPPAGPVAGGQQCACRMSQALAKERDQPKHITWRTRRVTLRREPAESGRPGSGEGREGGSASPPVRLRPTGPASPGVCPAGPATGGGLWGHPPRSAP